MGPAPGWLPVALEDWRQALLTSDHPSFSRMQPCNSIEVLTAVMLACSGTEWFEAGDADSRASSPGSFARADEEKTPEPEEAPVGQRLDLALLGVADSSAADMLGHAAPSPADRPPAGSVLLKAAAVHGGIAAAGHLGPIMMRIFTEVNLSISLLNFLAVTPLAATCAPLTKLPALIHFYGPACTGSMQQKVFLKIPLKFMVT